MAKEFFNPDMEFFLDHRIDWARYFQLRGAGANWRDVWSGGGQAGVPR